MGECSGAGTSTGLGDLSGSFWKPSPDMGYDCGFDPAASFLR